MNDDRRHGQRAGIDPARIMSSGLDSRGDVLRHRDIYEAARDAHLAGEAY